MSERVCPNCGAPLEGVSIYDDVICDYCGSEVKGKKKPAPPTVTGNGKSRAFDKTYQISWIDTYITNSDYKNRLRCVAIQEGETRKFHIILFFKEIIKETIRENVELKIYSYSDKKIVFQQSFNCTFNVNDNNHSFMIPMKNYKSGEYLCIIQMGESKHLETRFIIGNAPILQSVLNEAENRERCRQIAKERCGLTKVVRPWMTPVPSDVMALKDGIKYRRRLGIPEGIETYMIIELSVRKGKKGIAICNNGLYISSDCGNVYMSWYELLLTPIYVSNGLKVGKHSFLNVTNETGVMADLLADIQRRIIDDIKF